MVRHDADFVDEGIVFRIWRDGKTVERLIDETAPELYWVGSDSDDGLLIDSSDAWFTVSEGYTNQDHYNGPVMHDSEFISDGMMWSIMEQYDPTCHYFVVRYPQDSTNGDVEGWVILAKHVTV